MKDFEKYLIFLPDIEGAEITGPARKPQMGAYSNTSAICAGPA